MPPAPDTTWLGILDRGLGIYLVVLASVLGALLLSTLGVSAWKLFSKLAHRFADEKLTQMAEQRQNARTIAQAVATCATTLQGVDRKIDALIAHHR